MALSLTYQQTEQLLKRFQTDTFSADDIPFMLLEAMGKHEAEVRRYRAGKGIVAAYKQGLLIKNLIAFRSSDAWLLDSELDDMKKDPLILRATPKIISVSDGKRILAYDTREQETYDQPLNKLYINFQFFYPLVGVERFHATEENPADVKAAEKMAKLHDEIRAYNDFSSTDNLHDLNIFMSRLLFCFFAEDTNIFADNLFTSSIERYTKQDGSDTATYIENAFAIMDKQLQERHDIPQIISQFPYVNGSLFAQRITIPRMGRKARQLLIECGSLNWKDINPDIFGSMIQAVVSPSERGSLGMHYTSVPNIMKVIQPLFLDALYRDFADAKDNLKLLQQLLVRMSHIRFFDPACGSGNFLIIAYKELRKLEIQIWQQILKLEKGQQRLPFVSINIDQFYGIEIDDFACEVAELSLRLAEHQMNAQFMSSFAEVSIPALPLKKMEHIVKGNACRIDWNTVCPHNNNDEVYLMGNPPYLGSRRQDNQQKADMQHIFTTDFGEMDYICCWFKLGADYIQNTKAKFAFVTTNSVCQGLHVALLWKRILTHNLEIYFAYTSFKWANNAKYNAGVTCHIVGVEDRQFHQDKKIIYQGTQSTEAQNIAPYIIDSRTLYIESRNQPLCNVPQMNFGNMPADGGKLILSTAEKQELEQQYPLITNYIRPLIGAEEFINGRQRWCIWLYNEDENQYLKIPAIKQRINDLREIRAQSSRPQLADIPHLFAQITQPMNTPVIVIPRVSSEKRNYIPISILPDGNIVADSCMVIGSASLTLFGLLTSYMHMLWLKTIGGKLETRYRYSAKIVYNNFPFPRLTTAQRQDIEHAAEEVLLTREDYPALTLADLYNPDNMPLPLRQAHNKLDNIVEQCYSNKPFTNDEQRLETLFKLYEKLINK